MTPFSSKLTMLRGFLFLLFTNSFFFFNRIDLPIPDEDLSYTPFEKIKYPSYKKYFTSKLYRILSQGLGIRTKQIALLTKDTPQWGLDRRRMHEVKHGDYVLVGLVLNDQECERLVTFGPDAEHVEETKAFRNFWGNKAELRRFQDGSIKEAVVWAANPNKLIVNSICQYLIDRHLGGELASTLKFDHDKLLRVLQQDGGSSSSRALFQAKQSAFQKLVYFIQEIKELPLRVNAVYGTSSSLRDTSLGLPLPFDLQSDDSVASGVIEFESSSKWPDDIDAVEKLKTAFLLKLEEVLNNSNDYKASTGVEDDFMDGAAVSIGFLQVLTGDGYAFKLRVATYKDALLYTKLDTKAGPHSANLALQYKQKYLSCISHTRVIHTLSLRFPFYSSAVRLVKSWFNAHLLTGQMSEEAIELLTLVPFLDSAPYLPPSSGMTGFTRTLEFLSTWNWRDDPIILDVDKQSDRTRDADAKQVTSGVEGTRMDNALYLKLVDSFKKLRETDPVLSHAPLFIGTRHDITGVAWTRNSEVKGTIRGKLVAARMTALARKTVEVLTLSRVTAKERIRHVFEPSVGDYDLVIYTRGNNRAASTGSAKDSGFKNLGKRFPKSPEELAAKTCKPVDALYHELSAMYKDTIIFFKGTLGVEQNNNIIGGVWYRDVVDARQFKIGLGFNSIPASAVSGSSGHKKAKTGGNNSATTMVVLNKEAILKEIENLGGDLIDEIELK